MKIIKKKIKKGVGLIELVVSSSILTFIISVMMLVLMSFLNMSKQTRDINIAKELIAEYTSKANYIYATSKLSASSPYVVPSRKPSEFINNISSIDTNIDNRIFIREEIIRDSISYPISSTQTSSVEQIVLKVSVFSGNKLANQSFAKSKLLAQNSVIVTETRDLTDTKTPVSP